MLLELWTLGMWRPMGMRPLGMRRLEQALVLRHSIEQIVIGTVRKDRPND